MEPGARLAKGVYSWGHDTPLEGNKILMRPIKGVFMSDRLCDIAVASCSKSSNRSLIFNSENCYSQQYFVELIATRDAYHEERGWHYPIIIRFENLDVFIDKNIDGLSFRIGDAINDASTYSKGQISAPSLDADCFYLSRVKTTSTCAGERLVFCKCANGKRAELLLILEEHMIRIS